MSWTDQNPPATDVIAGVYRKGKNINMRIEVDKVGDEYRFTGGNLFGSQELCRTRSLDTAFRLFGKISQAMTRSELRKLLAPYRVMSLVKDIKRGSEL